MTARATGAPVVVGGLVVGVGPGRVVVLADGDEVPVVEGTARLVEVDAATAGVVVEAGGAARSELPQPANTKINTVTTVNARPLVVTALSSIYA